MDMVQQARNLALDLGERFTGLPVPDPGPRLELHCVLRCRLPASGTTIVRTAVQAPRTNAHLRARDRHPAP